MKSRILLLATVIGLLFAYLIVFREPSFATRIRGTDEEIRYARREIGKLGNAEPDEHDVIMFLAQKAVLDERWDRSEELFALIPTSHKSYGRSARHQQGQVLLRLNRSVEAEEQLREFIRLEQTSPTSKPEHLVDAIQRLRSLLEMQLRFEERRQLIAPLALHSQGDASDVVFYCFPNLLRWNGSSAISQLEAYHKVDPNHLNLRIALGRYRAARGRFDEAEEILDDCLAEAPNHIFVVAAHIELLKELADWDSIQEAIGKLGPASKDDPWHLLRLRGHAANRKNDFEVAIHCFQLALQSDPANSESYSGLARSYYGLNCLPEQKNAAHRAQVLTRIQNRLGWTQSSPDDVSPLLEIVDLCLEIELHEQAYVIARLANRLAPNNAEVVKRVERTTALFADRPNPQDVR